MEIIEKAKLVCSLRQDVVSCIDSHRMSKRQSLLIAGVFQHLISMVFPIQVDIPTVSQ